MVIFESIVFEKLFQEDHARGGRGEFANGDEADCAGNRDGGKSTTISTANSRWVNAFANEQRIFSPAVL
jgi:hypothetical protein